MLQVVNFIKELQNHMQVHTLFKQSALPSSQYIHTHGILPQLKLCLTAMLRSWFLLI